MWTGKDATKPGAMGLWGHIVSIQKNIFLEFKYKFIFKWRRESKFHFFRPN